MPCATCEPLGFADEGSVPREKCVSKKFLSGLLDSSSESFTRTLIAVLKKPQKECNNLFFTVKMGGSPLQAISLQLKTCRTSGLGSRFALMVVHGTTGGHISRLMLPTKAGRIGSLFLPPLTPSVTATAAAQQNAPGFQKDSDATRKSLKHGAAPQKAEEGCCKEHGTACTTHGQTYVCLHVESISTHPRAKPDPPFHGICSDFLPKK